MSKPYICLNMIVKNEAHIILETLNTIYSHIDYYVINDTGSTDDTVKIIKDFFNEKGIPGEVIIHEFRTCTCHSGIFKKYDFFHFGWNRTYALQACAGKSEYIWVIDADDLPVVNFIIPRNLTADCYKLKIGKDFTYLREQIFKNDAEFEWQYVGAVHEYPKSKNYHTSEILEGDYYIDSRRLGDRSKDTEKYLKDAKIFDLLLIDEPNNERYMFYCGQSYFDYKDYKTGIDRYSKRTKMGGFFEEVYYSYYKIAVGKTMLDESWSEIEKAYMVAHEYCKYRAEPLYEIANHYLHAKNYQKSYDIANSASKIKITINSTLFVSKDIYTYKSKDVLAQSAYYIGKYVESLSLYKQLLHIVPSHEVERITNNIKLCESQIATINKKTCYFYMGNTPLVANSISYKIILHATDFFKVVVIGNKIDLYCLDNVMFISVDKFKSMKDKLVIDYLVLVNLIIDMKIKCSNTILLQYDKYFLMQFNDFKIGICNKSKLNDICKSINKIVCIDISCQQHIDDLYGLHITCVDNDYHLIYDNENHKYIFNHTFENDTNGLVFIDPPNINDDYEQAIIKFLPTHPESYYKVALLHMTTGNDISAEQNLNKALKISKNKQYDDIIHIKKAELLTRKKKYQESYDLANAVLNRNLIFESLRIIAEDIRDNNIDFIKHTLLTYPSATINTIVNKPNKKIMFSITTCKRYDLFEKTINSFINTCLDYTMIDHWLCIDDNSSEIDRTKMQKNYPFFEYIWKDNSQKGHYISMNMIHAKNIEYNCEYNLHIEDDFHFIQKRNYLTESILIMSKSEKIGQVLFNRNYAEIPPCSRRIPGGILKNDGIRYVIHEYYPMDTKEYQQFLERHEGFGTCGYWPHFSFRPSVRRVATLKDIGIHYNTSHFEMQYAIEYIDKNYVSAFMDTFSCIHIGKKTWESNVENSYNLNQLGQFEITSDLVSINVLSNMDHPDQWKRFKDSAVQLKHYTRLLPKHITILNDYEKKLFYDNTFNYNREIISSIMTHINLMKNNTSKYLMIVNDDVVMMDVVDDILELEFDMVLLDYHMVGEEKLIRYDKQVILGDIHGYIISQSGIQKILDHINIHGIKNLDYLPEFTTYILNKKIYQINNKLVKINNDYVELSGYKFYSQLDSFGDDEGYYGSNTVDELRKICDDKKCLAFNTLGYVKYDVVDEKDFIYLPTSIMSNEGMYVKIII